jgi:hypothetical protein
MAVSGNMIRLEKGIRREIAANAARAPSSSTPGASIHAWLSRLAMTARKF